jgi:beta-lactamase class A
MVSRIPFIIVLLQTFVAVHAQTSPIDILEQKLREKLKAFDSSMDGVLGVAAIDLTSGRNITFNPDTLFATASTIKVPILIEMFRLARAGEFKMTDKVTLETAELVGGSGKIQDTLKNGPVTMTVMELITAMMEHSDNTATNRAIQMARMERVNRRTQELGLQQTRLRRIMLDSDAASKGMENVSTPLEMARLMELIYREKAGAAEDCKEMMRIMKLVKGQIRASVPATVEVASKTGDLVGVKCETAVVLHPKRPFVLSVYGSYLKGEANPVGAVTKLIYDHFDLIGSANAYGNRGVR